MQKNRWLQRARDWLTAMPHPDLAVEIGAEQISAVRWNRSGLIENLAVEPLPPGALVPSPIETNVVNGPAIRTALTKACASLRVKDQDIAVLLPDQVVRVFIQHFDDFPRSDRDAAPILRWKLKRSVPFELDDTVLSYRRQSARGGGVDVVTVLARRQILREYEELAESQGMFPGVILSSSLAALALLDEPKPSLVARLSGDVLTTLIVEDDQLFGYRCRELPVPHSALTPKMLLDEIFPMAAYSQDMRQQPVQSIRITGLGPRYREFASAIQAEFHCDVGPSICSPGFAERLPHSAQPLLAPRLEGLLGWMVNRA